MKKIKTLILTAALLLPITAVTPGCALFSKDTTAEQRSAQIHDIAYAAASIGTQVTLQAGPQYRPEFELAWSSLDQAIKAKTVSGLLIRDILEKLPNKELKTDKAQIFIENGTILYDAVFGNRINLQLQPDILAAATGIRDGIGIALGHATAQ